MMSVRHHWCYLKYLKVKSNCLIHEVEGYLSVLRKEISLYKVHACDFQ